ncbi:MAG: RDD family protein, partial [Rhodanobacter sp.]
ASPIASSVSVAPLPQVTALSLEDYAGFWKRVGAYILDFLVLYIPNMLISKMMGGDAAEAVMRQTQEAAPGNMDVLFAALNQYYATMAPAMMITFVLAWLYFAFCESSAWQATVGKLALGIRVTDLHGERITLPRALARYPAKILCVLTMLIGFLMVAFTQRKQGLHDLIAGTLVLNGRVGEFKPKSTTDNNNSFSA